MPSKKIKRTGFGIAVVAMESHGRISDTFQRLDGPDFNISSEEWWKRKDYSKISSLGNRVNMIADNWDMKNKKRNKQKNPTKVWGGNIKTEELQ